MASKRATSASSASASEPEGRPSSAEVRQRLLDAARAEFFANGFTGTDTNRIARAAGLGAASFYRHFEDKTEAFRLVYEEWIATCWKELGEAVARGTDLSGVAKAMADVIARQYKRARGLRASVHALAHRDPEFRRIYLAEGRRQIDIARARHAARNLPEMRDEEHLAMFYFVERLADALAFEELQDMGCKPSHLKASLIRVLEQYLAGRPIGG